MRINSGIEIELIMRYLSGAVTEEEMESVLDWLAKDVENRKYFSEIRQIWIESENALQNDDFNLDEKYNRLISRIKSNQGKLKERYLK